MSPFPEHRPNTEAFQTLLGRLRCTIPCLQHSPTASERTCANSHIPTEQPPTSQLRICRMLVCQWLEECAWTSSSLSMLIGREQNFKGGYRKVIEQSRSDPAHPSTPSPHQLLSRTHYTPASPHCFPFIPSSESMFWHAFSRPSRSSGCLCAGAEKEF